MSDEGQAAEVATTTSTEDGKGEDERSGRPSVADGDWIKKGERER